jgi:hypothetical protein
MKTSGAFAGKALHPNLNRRRIYRRIWDRQKKGIPKLDQRIGHRSFCGMFIETNEVSESHWKTVIFWCLEWINP